MSLEFVLDYLSEKRKTLAKENDSIDILSTQVAEDELFNDLNGQVAQQGADDLNETPLNALDDGFIGGSIGEAGRQILNGTLGKAEEAANRILGIPVRKTIEDAQKTVYHMTVLSATLKQDLMIVFLQQTAQEAIKAIDKKREIAEELRARVRKLYNALIIIAGGDPYFDQYLGRLREALIVLARAERRFISVRNNFFLTGVFTNKAYDLATNDLLAAKELISPTKEKLTEKFATDRLLKAVGATTLGTRIALIMSIPQLVQDVWLAANGYFVATLKLNALIIAFLSGLAELQDNSSKKLRDYSVDMLDQLISRLTDLINRMATGLNGAPSAINGPLPDFRPAESQVSADSLRWLLDLQAIIGYSGAVPGQAFNNLALTKRAIDAYNKCANEIKALGNQTRYGATLRAFQGQEQLGDLEQQVKTFTLAALAAIPKAKVSEETLALGRTLIARIDLSLDRDAYIRQLFVNFADFPVEGINELKRTRDSIVNLLNDFGLDRAAALFTGGQFGAFFNLNSKTATFAGAALIGLGLLKECLHTTEDRERLTKAERELQRDSKAKELLCQRSALTGFQQQKVQNKIYEQQLQAIDEQARDANGKCPTAAKGSIIPTDIVRDIGNVIGIGVLGKVGSTKFLTDIGKGIL